VQVEISFIRCWCVITFHYAKYIIRQTKFIPRNFVAILGLIKTSFVVSCEEALSPRTHYFDSTKLRFITSLCQKRTRYNVLLHIFELSPPLYYGKLRTKQPLIMHLLSYAPFPPRNFSTFFFSVVDRCSS